MGARRNRNTRAAHCNGKQKWKAMTYWGFEENGFFVKAHESGDWIVFRPSQSGTHSESDCAFPAGVDGLGCAIARVLYLARGAGRGTAVEGMRLAESHTAKARGHGARNRAALAALDSMFAK
jgi:hypothetical protein